MSEGDYGFLRFDDLAAIEQSGPRTPREEAWELLGSVSPAPIGPLERQRIVDWPRITQCIRSGTRISVTAVRPEFTVSLIFDPAAPSDGRYDIRGERPESGRTSIVVPLDDDSLSDHRFGMLAPYPIRFQLITHASDRVGTQRFWRIGISSCTDISDDATPNA